MVEVEMEFLLFLLVLLPALPCIAVIAEDNDKPIIDSGYQNIVN